MAGVPGPGGDPQFNWDQYTAPASSPVQDDAMASVRQWYRQYLGREATDQDARDWANNPNGIQTVEQTIRDSPEAKAYATAHSAAGGASGSGQGDPEGFRAAWFASGGKTVDDLRAFVAAHPEYGATITGSKGSKLTFPGGQAFQAVRSAGLGGGIGPAWDDISGGGAQGGGAAGAGFGSYLTPWDKQFAAPTAEEALNSPGLKFALEEANRIGQNSAAAHGSLLNGRVQQALGASNVQNALQGYGDVYNRAMGEYKLGRENFYNNQDRPYTKLSGLAGMGADAANQTGGYGSSYGSDASGAIYGAGNATSAGSTRQGNVWGDYVSNLGGLLGGR